MTSLLAALRITALCVLVLCTLLVPAGTGAASPRAEPPAASAASYLLVGDVDGRDLASRNPDERRPVASITKLMTVLVARQHARLDAVVTVAPAAAGIGESSLALRPGERVTVRDLAIGALVPSANDAATALALHVGRGSLPRFVAMMNREARSLGLTRTIFRNPHGLDEPGHLSTARDTVTLLRAALRDPFIRHYAAAPEATLAGRVVESTDALLGRIDGIVGAKTGHTNGAGWSQVALVRRGGVQVAASVLGAPSEEARNDDLARLLEWGLARYVRVRAIVGRRAYASAAVGWGKPDVRLLAPRTLVEPVALDVPLREQVVAPAALALPVAKGQRLGEVRVYAGSRLVARAPLVADRAVERPSLAGRARWYARRAVHHVVDLFR